MQLSKFYYYTEIRYKLKIALFRSPLCFNLQRDSNGAYKTLKFFFSKNVKIAIR